MNDIKIKIQIINNISEALSFIEKNLNIDFSSHPTRSKEYILKLYTKLPEFFIGAYLNNKLIGALFSYPDFANKQLLIGELCVDKNFRRKGIGRALINQAISLAKEYKFTKIYGGAREGAEQFYLKCGFTLKLLIQTKNKIQISNDYIIEKYWQDNEIYFYIISNSNCESLKLLVEKLNKNNIISYQYIFEYYIK